MSLSFGVTVLPDPPYQRMIELFQLAEQEGFEYGWTYDSHVLWQESMPTLALAAAATERIKLGHMVTNPGTRDPTVVASAYATLQDISDGRMIMGIGRGDSARRYINQKPVPVARFEESLRMIKPFMNGEKVEWNDTQIELAWVRPELPEIEMHVAGYGPRVLSVAGRAGRRGDHPARRPRHHPVDDGHRPQGRRGGGPRPGGAQVHRLRAEPHLGRLGRGARAGALVPGDGLQPCPGPDRPLRRGRLGRAKALTDYVPSETNYDYGEHSRVGAKHGAFVSDEICDRFCVLGTPEQAIEKLNELASIGVDQFNVYLMTEGQEETLETYGREIIPHFAGVTGGAS